MLYPATDHWHSLLQSSPTAGNQCHDDMLFLAMTVYVPHSVCCNSFIQSQSCPGNSTYGISTFQVLVVQVLSGASAERIHVVSQMVSRPCTFPEFPTTTTMVLHLLAVSQAHQWPHRIIISHLYKLCYCFPTPCVDHSHLVPCMVWPEQR